MAVIVVVVVNATPSLRSTNVLNTRFRSRIGPPYARRQYYLNPPPFFPRYDT